jgi:PIN domain nuclease of toxin-antitoxin system
MKLLLDAHALLWFLDDDPKLSPVAKAALVDPANERWVSPISLVEIARKARLGKLPLSAPFGALFPAQLAANRIQLLPMEARHIEPLTTMPFHHKDPFDRLVAATALVETMRLVSADAVLDAYGVIRLW